LIKSHGIKDDSHIQVCPLEDTCMYSGWIMCGSWMVHPYRLERMLRQWVYADYSSGSSYISSFFDVLNRNGYRT